MRQAEADTGGPRGTDEGGKLKEAGITHWSSPNTGATNESGFTALPGGYRAPVDEGYYADIGIRNCFWSSTGDWMSAWQRALFYSTAEIGRWITNKQEGYSIRCVRD